MGVFYLAPNIMTGVILNLTLSGTPVGIWPEVRTYDAEEWGGGG